MIFFFFLIRDCHIFVCVDTSIFIKWILHTIYDTLKKTRVCDNGDRWMYTLVWWQFIINIILDIMHWLMPEYFEGFQIYHTDLLPYKNSIRGGFPTLWICNWKVMVIKIFVVAIINPWVCLFTFSPTGKRTRYPQIGLDLSLHSALRAARKKVIYRLL